MVSSKYLIKDLVFTFMKNVNFDSNDKTLIQSLDTLYMCLGSKGNSRLYIKFKLNVKVRFIVVDQ